MFERVCIVGVGLIGGSFGIALRRRKLAREVVGAVRRTATIDAALQKQAVDWATTNLLEAVSGSDLILLAPPVGQMKQLCETIAPAVKPGAIVTDAGSTKAQIVTECAPIFAGSKAHFIGGHPMAGSEQTGVESSKGELFEGATWILTPTDDTPPAPLARLQALVEAIGAHPLLLEPQLHDELLAVTSHLPHITAAALVRLYNRAHGEHELVSRLIAGGWRDSTRIAAGSPEMWRDICLANAQPIEKELETLIEELGALQEALKAKDASALQTWFGDAAKTRSQHNPLLDK